MVNNWQTTIRDLFSQDAATAAVALMTIKSSYAEDDVKVLNEKIEAALAADKCHPIFYKFNPSPAPENPINFSGNIHGEAALASFIALLVLRLYGCNNENPFIPVLFCFHS
jgi:hypothetical protein